MCIVDATVFGVTIPNKDGKAGMIAVALTEETNQKVFFLKNTFPILTNFNFETKYSD